MWYINIYKNKGDKGFDYVKAEKFLTFGEAIKFLEEINESGNHAGMIYKWQLESEDSKLKITKGDLIKEIDIFKGYVKEFLSDISEGLTDPDEEPEIISSFLNYLKYALGKM